MRISQIEKRRAVGIDEIPRVGAYLQKSALVNFQSPGVWVASYRRRYSIEPLVFGVSSAGCHFPYSSMRRREPHLPGTPAIPERRTAHQCMIGSREGRSHIDILERIVVRYGACQNNFDSPPPLRSILRRKCVHREEQHKARGYGYPQNECRSQLVSSQFQKMFCIGARLQLCRKIPK
jgi:hypothetical protein